jgi:hypothetical protein
MGKHAKALTQVEGYLALVQAPQSVADLANISAMSLSDPMS